MAGLCGTAILLLALLLAVDGMIAGGRKDPFSFDLLPGETLALSDTLPRGAEGLKDLALVTSDPALAPRFVETFSGFWLGGTLWRAELRLPETLPPGEYSVAVRYAANGTEPQPRQAYSLHLRKDAAAIQAASLSLTTRLTGLSPYALAAMLLPLALLPMAASFILSRNIAQALRNENMAEIYRAMASPEGQRIYFTLSGGATPAEGAAIAVLDERGQRRLGTALVFAVRAGDVEAVMQDDAKVRPGSLAKPD